MRMHLHKLAGIFFVLATPASAQFLARSELTNMSRVLKLSNCTQGWIDEKDISFSEVITGNRLTPCAYWKNIYGQGFSVISSSVSVKDVKIPVVVFFNNADIVSNRIKFDKVIIKLNGGPSGSIGPSLRDSYVAKLSSPGTVFVTLGYTGTYYGSLYPKSSFNDASMELASYIKEIYSKPNIKSIYVIGESLGGRIAAYTLAADKIARSYVCRLVLVAPMARSPFGAISYAENELKNSGKASTKINTRLILNPRAAWSDGVITPVPSILLLKSFFPSKYYNKDLDYMVSPFIKKGVSVIYGNNDNVADWKALNLMTAVNLKSRQTIANMGHIPNDQELKEVIKYIEKDISSPCKSN